MTDFRQKIATLRDPSPEEKELRAALDAPYGGGSWYEKTLAIVAHRRHTDAMLAVVAEFRREADNPEWTKSPTHVDAFERAADLLLFALGLGAHPDDEGE